MRGKLIVIEGTDCSGKETQSNLLVKKFREIGIRMEHFSYPNYNSPTGKIVGGPYLGKDEICKSYFMEGSINVDPKIASLYYAADRKYNIHKITWLLDNEVNVIVDRYVYSNMAHQGGKLNNLEKKEDLWNYLEKLEFDLLDIPKPDISILLHMPASCSIKLRENRISLDEHERSIEHLEDAEKTYLQLAEKYNFKVIECYNNKLRSIENIHDELFEYIKKEIQC